MRSWTEVNIIGAKMDWWKGTAKGIRGVVAGVVIKNGAVRIHLSEAERLNVSAGLNRWEPCDEHVSVELDENVSLEKLGHLLTYNKLGTVANFTLPGSSPVKELRV